MVARTLITTADERTWPKDTNEPVLFLGEWCKRYSRKHIWEKMDYIVADYHWDDRNKLYDDYQYLQELYEELLLVLSDKLNHIHGTNHSLRYWRILVGLWLGYFIQALFDRWFMLSYAITHYNISRCYVLDRAGDSIISDDMEHFVVLFLEDDWNEMVYTQLLEQYWGDDIDLIKTPLSCDESIENTLLVDEVTFKDKIKTALKKAIQIYNSIPVSEGDVFFISSCLPLKLEIKLQLKLKQIPKIRFSEKTAISRINLSIRRWKLRKRQNDSNVFSACVRRGISQHMPKVYLEGFKSLASSVKSLSWPYKPRSIFTSNSYSSDDTFKCWAAEKTENMVPLVIAQHGGHFGMNTFSFHEEHQIEIADKWLSWGYSDDTRAQIMPFGNIKTIGLDVDYDPNGGALMVEGTWPRYSYHLSAVPIASQWMSYFHDQQLFIESLPMNLRSKVTVRLYSHDFGWEVIERWKDSGLKIQIESGKSDIQSLIKKSRLYIATYNATTYLESLSWNMPTIIFWNPEHWELNDNARPYFELLKNVGVFHDTPESAAKHMINIWDDINSWWGSDVVQQARIKFMHQYSRTPNNPLKKLQEILEDIS